MASYLIKSDTLTDIADAIREMTGTTGAMLPGAMPAKIRSIQGGASGTAGIPDDIVAEAERVASSIQSKKASNSITFIAISDMHEMGDSDNADGTILERYRRANRNAGQAAKLIADMISPDFFANLGDLAWGSSSTTLHDWAQSVAMARGYTAAIEGTTEAFYTPGNHDVDYADGYLDPALVTGLIGTYRYVDFTDKKVRVICLNTADITDGTNGTERISGEQLQWFAESLDLSAKSDATEWGIIILSHHPLDWGNILPATNCLQAYLSGSSYSATHDGLAVSYDFTGKNAATVIANFHGHVHGFKVDYINCGTAGNLTQTTVKRIAIPNACYARTNEYGENTDTDSNGIEFGEETSYEKNDNSEGKNTAFCVVTIELDSGIIYADCFGAGYDRSISYEGADVVTYTVTNNLSGATTSNGATVITAGSAYAALLSANDGYTIESVTITMGGVDVTDSVYGDEYIRIPEVTGDIVITVTTVQTEVPPNYTNLVPTSIDTDGSVYNGAGYKTGYRLNSSGGETELAGAIVSGFIPYNFEVIRAYGTANETVGNSGNYIVCYDSSFTKTYVYAFNSAVNDGATWEVVDGKYMLTYDPLGTPPATYFLNASYIRVGFASMADAANFVVTLDEAIE